MKDFCQNKMHIISLYGLFAHISKFSCS